MPVQDLLRAVLTARDPVVRGHLYKSASHRIGTAYKDQDQRAALESLVSAERDPKLREQLQGYVDRHVLRR